MSTQSLESIERSRHPSAGPDRIPPSLNQELDPLGWRLAAGTMTQPAYRDALAFILRRKFACSTVALWRVSGVQGEQTLDCLGHDRATDDWQPGSEALSVARLGMYFDVLNDRGVYACDDTLNDRNLDAMESRYCRPGAPRAFLDALIAINGRALGVLSCCQDSGPRHWGLDEETTLKRLGTRVALHLARVTPRGFGLDCTSCPREVVQRAWRVMSKAPSKKH